MRKRNPRCEQKEEQLDLLNGRRSILDPWSSRRNRRERLKRLEERKQKNKTQPFILLIRTFIIYTCISSKSFIFNYSYYKYRPASCRSIGKNLQPSFECPK